MKLERLPIALLLLMCAWLAFAWRSELVVRAAEVNDAVLHLAMVERADAAWASGGNPRDPWVSYWGGGFPVLRYYQHLPHFAIVVIHRATGAAPATVYHALLWLGLALLPLSFFWGARLLGLPLHTSALAGLCAPLVGVDAARRMLLGFQAHSFISVGPGLFTQLMAMLFFAPAIGMVHQAVLHGRRYGAALALLWATWLSHLLLGYTAVLLGLTVFARAEARTRIALIRVLALYLVSALTVLHLLLPTLLEARFLGRSIWEDPVYWDSFGAGEVLKMLAGAALLDGDRAPVLTLLAMAGLVIAAMRARRDDESRVLLTGFVVALLLFFGRPTWGALLHLLPFSGSLPLHRFICAVQYGGVLLAALALGAIWQRMRWNKSRARAVASVALTLLLLAPALWATGSLAARNDELSRASAENLAFNRAGLDEVLGEFARRDREKSGRGYAGASWNWGKDYQLAYAPVYMYWASRGLAAISYMFHNMSLNSDLEPLFDDKRRDHYELYNVRWLMALDRNRLPEFARVIAERPGIFAATVETTGFFEVVGVSAYLDASGVTHQQLYDFDKRFIESSWHGLGQFVRVTREPGNARAGERELGVQEQFAPNDWARPTGRVLKSSGQHDHFTAEVDAGENAWLLFRMTFHPGWRALVDGKPVETAMLSPSFTGIPLPPGHHEIEIAYAPGAWPAWLFYAGLFPIAIGLGWSGRRLLRR